ncbi:MAG: HD domain-containing protein [Oscillospiraceae bacterium]|jgi:tRNA nucleotidyltransferase (CCA-adding enzyme)|nr:HD domain-containing protein [Oscillospiraceae bacterium]MCI1990443.1 HD domain-containing protein [Oscillospiraceae bacterium]MCI2036058.1 HD domain-containing protein [Oscillospiraceae bacterium]
MDISIPPQVDDILRKLTGNGQEACVVGGCVRDSLLGRKPNDWDVATSSRPEETKRIFAGTPTIETGLKHGTVTVLSGGMPVEVTTYRVDGAYSDGRHPDAVAFTGSLKEDLARRDFTINALAYRPGSGLVDLFGGRDDLAGRRIRCVGEADRRFREDGLRILRALRFASVLGFSIEQETAAAALRNRELLDRIAKERIQAEFTKLLCGKGAAKILREYREIIARFIPEIRPAFGFEQHNPHHSFDVWEHTLRCVDAVEPEPALRLAVFLHDLGKPSCYSRDADGVGHFYGHAAAGGELARKILARLRYDKKTAGTVLTLVKCHDQPLPPDERLLRRRLNKLGEKNLRLLFRVAAADTKGKSPADRARLASLRKAEAVLETLLARNACFSLGGLAVNGGDLLKIGVPEGTEVGRTLRALLDAVMDGKCPNSKEALLAYARKGVTGP